MNKLNIIILYGGQSSEHEVSIRSAQSVIKSLPNNKYQIIPICINRQGKWLIRKTDAPLLPDYLNEVSNDLNLLPDQTEVEGLTKKNPKESHNTSQQPVVFFPVLHGPNGEDGTIQGMLEILKVPYVGSGVLGSALCMDKAMAKKVFAGEGLLILDYIVIKGVDWRTRRSRIVRQIKKRFPLPVFVKPANLGSSVGISKVSDWGALISAINLALRYDDKILIEQTAIDCREIEVSVLGGDQPRASCPGEVVPGNEFYDYKAKYQDSNSTLIIPAKLPQTVIKKIQGFALKAFLATECFGLARIDFFVERKTNRIYLNEINTMPGFTSISMYPKLWEASGIGYSELLDRLIRLAIERFQHQRKFK